MTVWGDRGFPPQTWALLLAAGTVTQVGTESSVRTYDARERMGDVYGPGEWRQ